MRHLDAVFNIRIKLLTSQNIFFVQITSALIVWW